MSLFDELLDDELTGDHDESAVPFWKEGMKNEEKVFKWVTNEYEFLKKRNQARFEVMRENMAIYRGEQFKPHDRTNFNDFLNTTGKKKKSHKLIVNHLYDITETIVSRSTRNKPAPDIFPANADEHEDRTNARLAKKLADHIAYINKIGDKHIRIRRQAITCGESYLVGEWNEHGGDIHPQYALAKEQDFVDEMGNPMLDMDGKPMKLDKPVMVGEVDMKWINTWRILLQNKDRFDDVDYYFVTEIEEVEKLIADYPACKNKIKSTKSAYVYEDNMSVRKLRNECVKITFYHKRNRFLPGGAKVVFTPDCVLEKGEFPFTMYDRLNLIRLTDVDLDDQLNGESFYEWVKEIQFRHNQLSSDIIKHQRLCAHPKWFVPKGRAKIEALGDDSTVVQFSGSVPPQLAVMSPNPPEVFSFRRELKEEMEQISTVTGTTRREPPPGVTASVSLRFLSELEAERISTSTSKDNEFMRDAYGLMLAIAGDKYDENDGRTIRVLGKDNKFKITSLKNANFSKNYDIRIVNTGALSESKTSKTAAIFDLLKVRPDILTDEQLIDTLDLGSTEKVENIIMSSLRAAEAENEEFLDGEPVEEPGEYEDHITHWNSHVQAMQSRGFKRAAPPEVKAQLIEHITLTEFLMVEKAKINPLFQSKLAELSLFPLYWTADFVPQSAAQQEAVVNGQANRGEEITAQIPGQDMNEPIEGEE
jgi:hypothetical protein